MEAQSPPEPAGATLHICRNPYCGALFTDAEHDPEQHYCPVHQRRGHLFAESDLAADLGRYWRYWLSGYNRNGYTGQASC